MELSRDLPLYRIPRIVAQVLNNPNVDSINERDTGESETKEKQALVKEESGKEKGQNKSEVQPLNFLRVMIPVQNVHERKEQDPRLVLDVQSFCRPPVSLDTDDSGFAVLFGSSENA